MRERVHMLDFLKFWRSAPASKTAPVQSLHAGGRDSIEARYESAQYTDENQPLWQLTDFLSPKAANSYSVRRTLKIRSRHEAANNSYFRGIIDTLANDLIGRGPRVQVRMMANHDQTAKFINDEYAAWCHETGQAEKLRTLCKARIQDGEGFGLHVTDRELEHPVKLNVSVIESDQVTTPDAGFVDRYWVDGMVLDKLGNPTEYHVLRYHPGDLFIPQLNPMVYDRWPVADVLHIFRCDRAGQVRGVPEITPSLELFAQLRRFTKSVLAASEIAANFAAVLETDAEAEEEDLPEPFETQPIAKGMLTSLPAKTKMNQFDPKQPSPNHEMWVKVLVREICRCLGIPLYIALGDFSEINYSAGRLGDLGYRRQQDVDRSAFEARVIRKNFRAWYTEARLIRGYLPDDAPPLPPPIKCYWPGSESIDPVKDATANEIELGTLTRTMASICAERGESLEEHVAQLIVEKKLLDPLRPIVPPPGAKAGDKTVSAAALERLKARGVQDVAV